MVLGHSSPKFYSLNEVVVVWVKKQAEINRGCLSSGFGSDKLVKNVQRINKMHSDTQNYSFEHFLFFFFCDFGLSRSSQPITRLGFGGDL